MASSCPPGNELPQFNGLDIPANITTVFTPGSNASDAAMIACCAPNTVHVAAGCYQWCEVPKARLEKDGSSQSQIQDGFGVCLRANGRNGTRIIGAHVATSATPERVVALRGLGLWALLISGAWAFQQFV
ncbi:hypothetical protein OQA88_12449 [Cercophora sp. LCS_1]